MNDKDYILRNRKDCQNKKNALQSYSNVEDISRFSDVYAVNGATNF